MTDIVERLRERARGGYAHDELDEEAADEIERLRAALKIIINECEYMAEARTQARRALEPKP